MAAEKQQLQSSWAAARRQVALQAEILAKEAGGPSETTEGKPSIITEMPAQLCVQLNAAEGLDAAVTHPVCLELEVCSL